jgi:hypothetical protein
MADNNDARARIGLPAKEVTTGNNTDAGGDQGAGDQGAGDQGDQGTGGTTGGTTTPGAQTNGASAPVDVPRPLSDEELLEELRKRNPSIQSLNDIQNPPTPESEEQKRKKKNRDMIAWAIKTDKIDTDKYNQYQVDSKKNARQIVYEDFAAKRKAKTPSITPEQIDREFKKFYHEDIDETDPDAPEIAAVAQEKMQSEAKRIVRRKYPEMSTIEKAYDDHVSAVNADKVRRENDIKFIQTYQKDLNDIQEGFTKKTYRIGDEQAGEAEDFEFEYPKEVLNQVRQNFLTNEMMATFIANYTKQTLQDAFQLQLLVLTDEQRIARLSRDYHNKQMKKAKIGRNNLSVEEVTGKTGTADVIDNEARSRVAAYLPTQANGA